MAKFRLSALLKRKSLKDKKNVQRQNVTWQLSVAWYQRPCGLISDNGLQRSPIYHMFLKICIMTKIIATAEAIQNNKFWLKSIKWGNLSVLFRKICTWNKLGLDFSGKFSYENMKSCTFLFWHWTMLTQLIVVNLIIYIFQNINLRWSIMKG